jgi:two-component sensor histidine kinase
LLREHGIVSLLNVPIMINGLTWGVLEVDSMKPSSFDEWDIGFMTMVANILGGCIALYEAQQGILEERSQRERERAQNNISVREIQHRVKNNFQIIIAFLSLKMRHSSAEVREKLTSVAGRIQAISLAHDLLSIGKQTSTVDFSDYLRSLCANIDPQRPDVAIEIEAERAEIPIDRAVPAGLVVNELVTNSINYAFANAGGRIRVHFAHVSNSSEGCVGVEDDGEGIAAPPKKGLGLRLVEKLAQQIQGRVDYTGMDRGTKIVLCFPVAT